MFEDIKKNDSIDDIKANKILKDLYESNFFEDVSVKYENKILIISVKEFPIIEKIIIEGIKAKKFEEQIRQAFQFRPRASFNEYILNEEENLIKSILKSNGYYFSKVET